MVKDKGELNKELLLIFTGLAAILLIFNITAFNPLKANVKRVQRGHLKWALPLAGEPVIITSSTLPSYGLVCSVDPWLRACNAATPTGSEANKGTTA